MPLRQRLSNSGPMDSRFSCPPSLRLSAALALPAITVDGPPTGWGSPGALQMWLQIAFCLLIGMILVARRDRVRDLDRPTPGLNRLYLWTRRLGIGATFYAALNLLSALVWSMNTSDWTVWKRDWLFWMTLGFGAFAVWFGLSQQPQPTSDSDAGGGDRAPGCYEPPE